MVVVAVDCLRLRRAQSRIGIRAGLVEDVRRPEAQNGTQLIAFARRGDVFGVAADPIDETLHIGPELRGISGRFMPIQQRFVFGL